MKRASYREAIEWIGLNDSIDESDDETDLIGVVSVALVADIFAVDRIKVVRDVFKFLNKVRENVNN